MDYTWSPKQKELLDSVGKFATEHLKERDVIENDHEARFDREAWDKAGEFGFQGLPVPADYGGRGLDPLTTVAVLERLGYICRDNGLIFSINAHLWTVVMPLITSGSEEQKQRFLPGLSNGTLIGGNAMTEAGSGSDAFSLSSTARRDGSKYILNGKKTFVSNGPVADVFTAYATVDPSLGVNGVTAFLVEKDSPGLTVTRQLNKMGLRTSPTGELQFDNCEVSVANRIGEEGAGSLIFSRSMTWERGCILANAVGSMQRMLEMCIRFAKKRRQGGHSIGSFQHVAGRIVDMKLRLETARQLLYHGAWLRSCGKSGFMEAAMTKLHLSDCWIKSCEDAIQIHGGYGYTVECELERELRDAMGSRLYSGTSEIQKNLIASLLGL
jgi:alkylation response protein AidB-like acyl-CoA dehydrogenase